MGKDVKIAYLQACVLAIMLSCPVTETFTPVANAASHGQQRHPVVRQGGHDTLALQVGEVRVLAAPGVARVAVGDGHVVHAVATEEEEVIVFARNEGSSALQVWTGDGRRLQYQVYVAAEGTRQAHRELRSLLERIPSVKVTQTGDKLVVEGDDLADDDRMRIADLARRYPQLLDLTGQVGWNSMVLLDVQVVEVPRSHLRELGLNWGPVSAGGVYGGGVWDAGSARIAARPGDGPFDIAMQKGAVGYLGANALLSARLHALEQQGEAVVLAQPQLLARSGATAEFLAGGEVPYTVADGDGNTRTTFKQYGVSLRITPHADRTGIVRAKVEVEVSAVDPGMSVPGGPSLRTRRAATEFNARSGQTLVLAGFLSRESALQRDGLPAVSRIPVLGRLFGLDRRQRRETELAIFVTPVLVDPDNPGVQERVRSAQGVLDHAFPAAPRLNTPIRADVPPSGGLLEAAVLPEPLAPDGAASWDPWSGQGSQWHADEVGTTDSVRRNGANKYAFTD